jgi:polar amino acid transport system substrate-binding protein
MEGLMDEGREKSRIELMDELDKLRQRITELEEASDGSAAERLAHISFLESLECVDTAMRGTDDIEQMLHDVVGEVLAIFNSDRAWLFYPCDPKASSWRVPMERTQPEYPGAGILNIDIPLDDEIRSVMETALAFEEPVAYDPMTKRPVPSISANKFSVKSQVLTTVFPKVGKPWIFGLHQCSYARVWSQEDLRLLKEIARRIADSLTSLLILQDLRASEQRFRAITENTSDITVILDQDGKYIYASPSVEKVSQYPVEELLGQYAERHILPEDAANYNDTLERAMAKPGKAFRLECFGVRPRKGHVVFLDGVFVSMVGVPSVGGVVVNCRDITERKKTGEENRKLRGLLGNIIDSMPSVLVGVDRNGMVSQWNREAERVTGVASIEAVGQQLTRVFPRLADDYDKVEQAMREGISIKDEKRCRETEDETRFEDMTVYPLVSDEDVDGAVIRIDDITERVRIEEIIIQSEKMISIGELAAGMAHEINNPLAGILQSTQVLKNRISSDLPANLRVAEECGTTMAAIVAYMDKRNLLGMVETLKESGLRAARIVDNMLSFSRKGKPQLEANDLCALLDRTVELASNDYNLKTKYDFRQIEITREYDPDLPLVMCEASKIQQVFLNLLTNGAQAMMSSSRRELPRITLRVCHDDGQVRVEVEDNGPGMDEAARKRVFEPFFTTRGDGTGLGLSVSYFIITEQHGGWMAVESALGRGTKFIVKLPIQSQKRHG